MQCKHGSCYCTLLLHTPYARVTELCKAEQRTLLTPRNVTCTDVHTAAVLAVAVVAEAGSCLTGSICARTTVGGTV
jgi:hypothetical protein